MDKLEDFTGNKLLLLLRQGDRDAFREIYNLYRNKVYSVALRILREEDDAEEVMQEVMLKLWLSAGNLKEDSNLEAWLKTITRNLSYNVLRRQALEAKTAVNRGADWRDFSNETEEHVLLNETKKVLNDAIDKLPPQQKLVYQLCHQQGLKYEEAARELNLSPGTVQSYMKLAIRSVRSYVTFHSDLPVALIILGLLKK